jgi:hypothetical protein
MFDNVSISPGRRFMVQDAYCYCHLRPDIPYKMIKKEAITVAAIEL